MLGCPFVRAQEQGRGHGEPKAHNSRALDRLRTAVDARSKDWAAFQRHAVEFHLRNVTAWADAASGRDLAAQIYPDFRHGPVAPTVPARPGTPTPPQDPYPLLSRPAHQAGTTDRHNGRDALSCRSTSSRNCSPRPRTASYGRRTSWKRSVPPCRTPTISSPARPRNSDHGSAEFADGQTPATSEKERGRLLRALSGDTIRGSLERHFGIALAFQKCHRVAALGPEAHGGATHTRFTSVRAQILNRSREFRDG